MQYVLGTELGGGEPTSEQDSPSSCSRNEKLVFIERPLGTRYHANLFP